MSFGSQLELSIFESLRGDFTPELREPEQVEIAGKKKEKQLEIWESYKSGNVTKREEVRAKKSEGKKKGVVADQEAEKIWKTVKRAVKSDPAVAEKIINPAKISELPAHVLWPVVMSDIKKDRQLVRHSWTKKEIA